MTLDIRTATSDDEPTVVELWRTCGLVAPYNDPTSDFHTALSGSSSTILIASLPPHNTTVGSVMVGHDGHRGWIYYLSTSPASRGRGVGKRLVEDAEAWLKARGVKKAQLLVRETNRDVVAFYERIGYEVAPRTVMGKWLEPAA